jgi:transcriptional regulator with XRE-family HTH domain
VQKATETVGGKTVNAARLAGSRIRQKRLDRGLRQALVAEAVGISASYLNLIEHNRRRIGGKLLGDIARVLEVDPAILMDGVDHQMLDQMKGAAALIGSDVELSKTEELAARYPGWSALIMAQARRIEALQAQVQVLSDRISFDPQLAQSLHEVITSVTAIRSSASILVGPEQLDADWQRRFHENIHNDSLRLAKSSEALVAYLETPDAISDGAGTAFEQREAYLAQTGFHLAEIEAGVAPERAIAKADLGKAASRLLLDYARQYADDAVLMPESRLEDAIRQHGYDPARLAQAMGVPFVAVLRRLATLPKSGGHPPLGLAISDAAGAVTLLKTVPGFAMPRAGGACPLWPVFSAASRPEQPLRLDVALPSQGGSRLRCYAIATTRHAARFDIPPVVESTMLVMPDPPDPSGEALPVGVSCRICPRSDCTSRREPAMIGL